MVYAFTNRRRAKDALLAVTEQKGDEGITILVREGMIYIGIYQGFPELSGIMHFGEPCIVTIDELMVRCHDVDSNVTELYRGAGLSRFRV